MQQQKLATTFTAAIAAGLTALAVSVAVPAIGDEAPASKPDAPAAAPAKPGDRGADPGAALRTCLSGHGQDVSGLDDYDLKRWIAEHQDDHSAMSALKQCGLLFSEKRPNSGPAPAPCGRTKDMDLNAPEVKPDVKRHLNAT